MWLYRVCKIPIVHDVITLCRILQRLGRFCSNGLSTDSTQAITDSSEVYTVPDAQNALQDPQYIYLTLKPDATDAQILSSVNVAQGWSRVWGFTTLSTSCWPPGSSILSQPECENSEV